MIHSAVVLFILGLIAVAIGFGGVGGLAINIGWVLLAVGVVLFIVNAVTGKKIT